MALTIVDREGVIPVAEMRGYFERAVRETPLWADKILLDATHANGEFSHYVDQDTNTLWVGFAIGMRCAERLAHDVGGGNP